MSESSISKRYLWQAAQVAAEMLCPGVAGEPPPLDEATHEADLRPAVERMLARAPRADYLFERSASLPNSSRGDDWIGKRVGPYRVLEPIQEGGMGRVYLAVRVDDFERKVALKVVRSELLQGAAVQRFENERQILARLDHPNIAKLLDGGTTVDGVPYLVMELIVGQPIDEYCASRRLSTADRIQLLRKVCSAVSALHAKFVVHRDLKPANILVTESGEPKVLDFGIAKPLALQPGLHQAVTELRTPPLTLLYASPEQVRGDPVDPVSDEYSLGVILYQLLVGKLPYQVDYSRRDEIARAICDEEPPRPSLAAKRAEADEEVRPDLASPRSLRGDLDGILLKALRKRPEDRYASVEQLSSDLERHLEGLPVSVVEGTRRYRTKKYLQRNRIVLSVTVLVVMLLLVALSGWWQAVHSLRQAHEERLRFEQIAVFLENVFKGAAPDMAGDSQLPARALLDRSRERLLSGPENPASVKADLASTLGDVYLQAGSYDEAAELVQEAVNLRRRHPDGSEDKGLLNDLNNLGAIEYERGDLDRAEKLFEEALGLGQRLERPPEELVSMTNNLGALAFRNGRLEKAEALYREGLAIRETAFGPDSLEVAQSRYSLAVVLIDLDRLDEAEALLRDVLAVRRRELGSVHTQVATTLSTLGRLLHYRDRIAEADKTLAEALEIRTALFADDNLYLALSRVDLALLRADQGERHQAEELLALAVPVLRQHSSRPDLLARADIARGAVLASAGKTSEAREHLTRAYDVLDGGHRRSARIRDVARRLTVLEGTDSDSAPSTSTGPGPI